MYTAAYAGVKYIFTQIGAGEKVAGSRAERISCAESGVLQCAGTDGTGRQVCAGSLSVYLE